jgi:DnaA family protein
VVPQLVLDLGPPPPPSFDNFVTGGNREALAAVRALLEPAGVASLRFLYLWGPAASGRTHLLKALERAVPSAQVRRLDPDTALAAFDHDPSRRLWLIDDCDRLDPRRQQAAFHLFDAVAADANGQLVCTGGQPPGRLALMPELSTRLGWGLVLQLHRLTDVDTARALAGTLAERGLTPGPDVIDWLMTHAPRDLGSLRALVDAIDAYALARKRALNVALLREFALGRARTTAGPGADPSGFMP